MAEPSSPPPRLPEVLYRRLRWLVILLILLLLLFCCGQVALLQPMPPVRVDIRSKLTADYSPWPYIVLRPIDPGIVGEIQQDDSRGGVSGLIPAIIGPVELWPIFVANLTPTPGTLVALVSPSATLALPPTHTPLPSESATPSQTSGATTTPTATSPVSFTQTRTPTLTGTQSLTASPTPTISPTNTSGPTVTPTATNPPGPTSTPTPTPTATGTSTTAQITGRVFEDTNYGGGNGSAFGGGDVALSNVTVELYTSGGAFMSSTTTVTGNYTFTVSTGATYIVRVLSASIGDADTPPAAGFNGGLSSAIPEQTFEHSGATGNGGAGALGGNNAAAADTATAAGGGAGDTNVTVAVGAGNVTGVDFGFTYNLTVNANDSHQGSLRQFILNANAVAGSNTGYFNLTGPAPYTINPASALPAITDSTVVDGWSQPGWTAAPLIEINGSGAGPMSDGLTLSAGNSTVRGLVINRFSGVGIHINGTASGLIQGNYIGTDSAGTGVAGNTGNGIFAATASNTIGGATITQRNVISGNNQAGITIVADNNTVQGNVIGLNISGTATLGNGSDGVHIRSSNNTVGGPAAGAGNIITGNGGNGVSVVHTGPVSGNLIDSNSIYSNSGLGIDLDDDGVTANDGALNLALANFSMDFPVFTVAVLNGSTLTVSGYVGNAPNNPTFASARVQVFESDDDASGNGEGGRLLTTLTADANGNFSSSFAVTGITAGDRVTATAINAANNTSEFGPNSTVLSLARVTSGLQALYTFEEGSGTTVNDVSGAAPPLNLTIADPGNVSWVASGLSVNSGTIISSGGAATNIIAPVQASNAITMEAWVQPASAAQGGAGLPRIVTISADPANRNVALVQGNFTFTDLYSGRLRTTATDLNGIPALDGPAGSLTTALQHIVYTRDAAGNATLYVNNTVVASGAVGGDLSNWDAGYGLALANEFTLDRPWLGAYYLVAFFDRALSAAEVGQNFAAGP